MAKLPKFFSEPTYYCPLDGHKLCRGMRIVEPYYCSECGSNYNPGKLQELLRSLIKTEPDNHQTREKHLREFLKQSEESKKASEEYDDGSTIGHPLFNLFSLS